jgi:hypothetical protein
VVIFLDWHTRAALTPSYGISAEKPLAGTEGRSVTSGHLYLCRYGSEGIIVVIKGEKSPAPPNSGGQHPGSIQKII